MSFDLADWLYPDATRERQPQGKLELDESSPLARGLYCYFDPLINRLVNYAGVTSSVNNGQRVIGTRGQAHARIDGYGSAIQQVLVPGYPATTSDFTLVTLCSVNQSNANAYTVVSTAQSSNAVGAAVETGDGTTKGLIRGRAYIGGTRYIGGSFTILDDDMHLLAFRQRYNAEQALFVDGVKDPVTGAFTGPGIGFSYCGAYTLAPYQKIGLNLWYNRALTDGELRALADNPWQLFRPRSLGGFGPVAAGGGSTLAIAKIFQSHALDGLTLTAQSDLAVTDANHGNAIGAIGLSASSLLAVGDASHDHLAENVALNTTGSENLIVLDSLHSHVADGVALTTQWLISVADALNSQSLESLTLSLDSHLAVADAGHGHASESMTLGVAGADNLVVSDVLHGQTAEGLALVTEWLLIVTDAAHAQLAESTILSTDALLVVQEASNDHLAENVALDTSDATTLATQGGVQWHTADGITLTLDTWLAIVGAAHAHAADAPTLSTEAALQIAEALHAHYADTVVLSFPGVTTLTPDDISAIAAAVLASLQATTIPVDAVTGAWPTAVENADALLSRTWP